MRITQMAEKINLKQVMDVSVDVHKDTLNFFFEAEGREYVDECGNRTTTLGKRLEAYHEIAREHGMKNLRIICEPTGQYHNKLFRAARSKGFFTCFVNAESVSKFRVIETNDTGKTDTKDPNIPPPTAGVISEKNIARLLGETGPLGDFANWRMLMRYGGLNIRMRQSGRYRGYNKISKKGRPLMRKILQNIALPMVPRRALYGEYYHRKKEIEKMPGNKAMTCVARHFLKKFFGWYKSAQAFDKKRFFACETQYKKAA